MKKVIALVKSHTLLLGDLDSFTSDAPPSVSVCIRLDDSLSECSSIGVVVGFGFLPQTSRVSGIGGSVCIVSSSFSLIPTLGDPGLVLRIFWVD